ncbi:Hsp20/alpha crystallin family protein [Sphingobacteriales bacterium UPWRP_1]|nr:Hsp20/alpha crystallin family protein [Sphingobacteriales bacterium UPWRP_1]
MELLDKTVKNVFGSGGKSAGSGTIPSINIIETNDSFRVAVAAPGYIKSDFKLQINNDVLTISAEKEQEEAKEGEQYVLKEYHYASFSRSFKLDPEIDSKKISANYQDGVLNITLGKKDEAIKQPGIDINIG